MRKMGQNPENGVDMGTRIDLLSLPDCRAGRTVERLQVVEGVDFVYNPPPRNKSPASASVDKLSTKYASAHLVV